MASWRQEHRQLSPLGSSAIDNVRPGAAPSEVFPRTRTDLFDLFRKDSVPRYVILIPIIPVKGCDPHLSPGGP